MKVRRFTDSGMRAFGAWVEAARGANRRGESVDPVPAPLLFGENETALTQYELPEGEPEFKDKLAIGVFCCQLIPEPEHEIARSDAALWSWLAARYFDQVTLARTKIKEPRAYVASIGFQDFYRHLILGPYYIYFMSRDDPDRVRVLLYDEPTTMNEVLVQFGSYQTLLQNPELQTVVQRLYFDSNKGRIKRGAGGKTNGAPRRLMDFFRQIELNYDLRSIDAGRFWSMLPKEFEKFKGSQESFPRIA